MRFTETELTGSFIVEVEHRDDVRGFFARTFCREEFARHGLPTDLVQCNVSYNRHRGTLRGLHYQDDPHPEGKLVRCTRGAIWDVIVDLRPCSPTCHRSVGIELSEDNSRALFIPVGFAHGFQTLRDDSEVFYQMTEFYYPDLARGVRWNDPVLAIAWPIADPIVSERDASYPDIAA